MNVADIINSTNNTCIIETFLNNVSIWTLTKFIWKVCVAISILYIPLVIVSSIYTLIRKR